MTPELPDGAPTMDGGEAAPHDEVHEHGELHGEDAALLDDGVPRGVEPSKVPEADLFRFEDVDRLDDRRRRRRGRRRALSLVFGSNGIDIIGSGARSTELLPWSEVASVTVGSERTGPDARVETPLEVVSGSGPARFVIHSEGSLVVQTDSLEVQLARWQTPSTEPQLVTIGALVAAVADDARPDAPPLSELPGPWSAPPVPSLRTRTRRPALLVAAVVLLVGAAGLAVGLSTSGRGGPTKQATAPAPTPVSSDQQLAQQLMLTRNDLPAGWRAARDEGNDSSSLTVQRGQGQITRTLARCMGITEAQAAIVLGGRAADQTAQAASPIFVAPTSASRPGSALEMQTTAAIVRSHGDEESDFTLFDNPRYPQCVAAAAASQIQLGVDETTGRSDRPSSPTVSPVDLPGPAGVQTAALIVAFDVMDGSSSVPVEVEAISLGSQRIEGQLQVFAVGGQIPNDVLLTSVSAFQRRVADGGAGSAV
ncbi:MAG: hypothetical protein ABSC90_04170 [Acidimicrobiales bacterium]